MDEFAPSKRRAHQLREDVEGQCEVAAYLRSGLPATASRAVPGDSTTTPSSGGAVKAGIGAVSATTTSALVCNQSEPTLDDESSPAAVRRAAPFRNGVAQSTAGRYTITLRQGNIDERHFGQTGEVT